MSSATATRRQVERPKTKSAKVFDGLLISDRGPCLEDQTNGGCTQCKLMYPHLIEWFGLLLVTLTDILTTRAKDTFKGE